MATIFLEGFDEYGPPANIPTLEPLLNAGGWSYSEYAVPALAASLNGLGGQSIYMGAVSAQPGGLLTKTLRTSYSRIIGGCRFSATLTGNNGVVFLDGSTAQCSVSVLNLSGFIAIMQGNNGTILQTSTQSVAANTIHYLEWDITFAEGAFGAGRCG